MGDGNYFIILSKANLKKAEKSPEQKVWFEIYEDPNPLGVEIPIILAELLKQDEKAKEQFESLSDGKKRTLIFSTRNIKNIDLQVEKILSLLELHSKK